MAGKASRCLENRDGFLPSELDYIPDDLQKRAKTELFEDEETRIHCLQLLRSMLKGERDLHWQDEEFFLLTFLRARKFDVKRTFQLMKTFYTVMGKHDELYYDFDFADVIKVTETNVFKILPYRDEDGSIIILISTACWDPPVISMKDCMRALTFVLLHANLSPATHVAGYKVVVDFQGFTMKHVPHVSPTYLWLFAEALQNCFPARFRAVHIVNEDYIFSYVWVVIKPFLKKKIKERFHFHGKNVKKLHKHISPNILPVEYGGELPSLDNSDLSKKLEEKEDYLRHVLSHGYKKYRDKAEEKKNANHKS